MVGLVAVEHDIVGLVDGIDRAGPGCTTCVVGCADGRAACLWVGGTENSEPIFPFFSFFYCLRRGAACPATDLPPVTAAAG